MKTKHYTCAVMSADRLMVGTNCNGSIWVETRGDYTCSVVVVLSDEDAIKVGKRLIKMGKRAL